MRCVETLLAGRSTTSTEAWGADVRLAGMQTLARPLVHRTQDAAVVKTIVLTDLVDSVGLVSRIGDARAAEVWRRHDRLARDLLTELGGREIDKTDGFLLLFERPIDAVSYVLAYHQGLAELSEEVNVRLSARAGIHLGEVLLRENAREDVALGAKPMEVEGLAKVTCARLMSLAKGRQTLLTRSAFDLARRAMVGVMSTGSLSWLAHGPYLFQGLAEPIEVFEVGLEGHSRLEVPADSAKARRSVAAGDEITLGWRPATGQHVVHRPHWVLESKQGEGGFGEVWLGVHEKTNEKRIFKFCHRADRLHALRREVTVFRVLRESLGERRDIARILDWNFDEAPYFLEAEYTAGGSLVEWADKQDGMEQVPLEVRLELMAQVAEALDASHSVGVLHKDVKPSNILVTHTHQGEPRAVLTDFGIGLITNQEVLAAKGITAFGLTEVMDSPTRASSATGTHLYVAPEMFEGKPATVQADIYSLGVMTFQVVVGDLSRALAPGWERDVGDELLCEDLAQFLDHSPKRRPRSALEVADRLRRLEERRAVREAERLAVEKARRAQRRRKFLVSFSVVATVFLVVVSVLGFQAMNARQEAELRRQQAEDLLSFLIGDLRVRLDAVGRLEILEDVADKALEYFASLPAERLTDVERAQRSKVLLLIGKILKNQGDLPRALETFQEALRMHSDLVEGQPANLEWRNDLASLHYEVGNVLMNQGDLDGASAQFRKLNKISERQLMDEPDNERWLNRRAYSLTTMGWLDRRRGNLDGALQYFHAALAINKRLANEDSKPLSQRNLAINYNAIASILEAQGDLKGALKLYRADLDIKRELVAADPDHSRWKVDLSTSHNLLARVLEDLGETTSSLEHYHDAIAILEQLVEEDSTNMTWRRNLAVNHLRVGDVRLRQGEATVAMDSFQLARELMMELVKKDSTKLTWRRDAARAHIALGKALAALARPGAALKEARISLTMLEAATEEHPENVSIKRWLVESYLLLGRLQATLGESSAAETAWRHALELVEPLARGSKDKYLLDPWVRALLRLDLVDEARPIVQQLVDIGYGDAQFLELCRLKGAL